jgi:malate dehydrogenase
LRIAITAASRSSLPKQNQLIAKKMPVEKRVDPEDGAAYSFEELADYYKGKYKKAAINAYWETCAPVKKAKGKGKGSAPEPKAKAKTKAKAKSEPKAKAKAKVKAKAKAKKVSPPKAFKVCVCGGAGGIGQPLSMLMAMDPNVGELSVFDLSIAMVPPEGVAADLGHLEKKSEVKGYVMEVGKKPIEHCEAALTGCDLVLIPAGMPRKPGQTRDDLFKVNADIAKGLVEACAKFCPQAILALIVNPVNSIVPAMAELYKKKGLDPTKIVGATTLDCVRANKFVSQMTGKSAKFVNVPVVGGHAGVTILPLFSQVSAMKGVDADKIPDLDKRVQDAGTEVVNAKNGKGSATLSMAYAGARLGSSILAGLSGRRRVECAYVASTIEEDFPYFTSKVVFGEKGVTKVLPVGNLSDYEKTRMAECKAALKTEIETGLKYAEANSLAD